MFTRNHIIKAAGWLVGLLCLVALPLAGVVLAGKSVAEYLEFPPLTLHVEHAAFSWPVFLALAILIVATVLPFLLRCFFGSSSVIGQWSLVSRHGSSTVPIPRSEFRVPRSAFPLWGWVGLAFGILAWVLAWTRFSWFAPLQTFTFSPLWLSYIIVVNALTYRRTGRCMLTDRPRRLASLFAVSAGFWWFFEYLNRFVQNWYYVGAAGLSPLQYFVFATLPFSTVLPAVMGTYEWLASFPCAGARCDDFVRLRIARSRLIAVVTLALFCAGLGGIGVWPDYLFPLLWISPLCILTALQALAGRPTLFTPVRDGRWRRIVLLALAALICGFFWEMWNYWSATKWAYAVPFVERFKIFEMPVLGFAGYLPFGLECAVVADAVPGVDSEGDPR